MSEKHGMSNEDEYRSFSRWAKARGLRSEDFDLACDAYQAGYVQSTSDALQRNVNEIVGEEQPS
jgi:hypothetical protein